ncbi:MAG: hypothetical protein ABFC89_04560 [Methanospirillum sp.]
MQSSQSLIDPLVKAVQAGDLARIDEIVRGFSGIQKRKERALQIQQSNRILEEAALEKGEPAYLDYLQELAKEEVDALIVRLTAHYLAHEDERWIDAILRIAGQLDRKSHQSRVLSQVSRTLVDTGVRERRQVLIERGMSILSRISFRKYRSALLIELVPALITWGITTHDIQYHRRALELVPEIGDVSERADLHCNIVTAMVTIGIAERSLSIVYEALRSASAILQKIRRVHCTLAIIDMTWRSPISRAIADIHSFMTAFQDLPEARQTEIFECLVQEMLERIRDKSQLYSTLLSLERDVPESRRHLVVRLLKKAESTGDNWYIKKALEFNSRIVDPARIPLKEIIHSGILIAEKTRNADFLIAILPLVDRLYDREASTRTYLQFTNTLLRIGQFYDAIETYARVDLQDVIHRHQIDETGIRLLKEAILRDEIDLVNTRVLSLLEPAQAEIAVYRAVYELCKEHPFSDTVEHIGAIRSLARLHPRSDQLLLDSITILIEHGFLVEGNPEVLIEFSDGIVADSIRESAISYIIRNLTTIGVEKRSRDFLQRGIGLASNIQGQHTRSEALFAVIEAASLLAVRQSDLDLLRRMRTWSTSLLEKEYATSAIGKIVQGMIRYALTEKTPYALDEADRLLDMIDDPALRQQLMERVIDAYIRVGCLRLEESVSTYQSADFADEARPFQRALTLIREHTKPSQVSLRIAGAIDIVLQYAERSSAVNFFVPLTLFSLEIDNPLERDAMISRIATGLREIVELLDSTDSYEVLAYLLMRLDQAETSTLIMDLACQLNDQIKDPYTKLSGMATLADLFMRQNRRERADQLIDGILVRLDWLPYRFQRVLILADIATLIVAADEARAYECMERAITLLPEVEPDRASFVRVQLVLSIVSLHAVNHNPENVPRAMAIVEGIENPEDYIEALIAVSNMVRDDTGSCRNILRLVSRSIEAIPNPYERGTALLNVIPIAELCGEHSYVDVFLAEVDRAMERINIPFIVAVLKRALVQRLIAIAQRRDTEQFTARAIEVARGIEDQDVRYETLQRLNQDAQQNVADSVHSGVIDAKRKIRSGEFSKNLIAAIDRSLHAVPDRALQAKYYTELFVAAKEAGQENLAEKLLRSAINAAEIIRPLSRRVYVLGDMALKVFAAGDEIRSSDIMDMAGEAATNIREFRQRDQIFDELAMVIKVMQELRV